MSPRPLRHVPARRARRGMTLIEVVVACTLLGLTLTALTTVSVKLAARTRKNSYVEQRIATLFQEMSRVESMPYANLTTANLITDSVSVGSGTYVWNYTVDPDSVSNRTAYRKITLRITARRDPSNVLTTVMRRARPGSNALNTGA